MPTQRVSLNAAFIIAFLCRYSENVSLQISILGANMSPKAEMLMECCESKVAQFLKMYIHKEPSGSFVFAFLAFLCRYVCRKLSHFKISNRGANMSPKAEMLMESEDLPEFLNVNVAFQQYCLTTIGLQVWDKSFMYIKDIIFSVLDGFLHLISTP